MRAGGSMRRVAAGALVVISVAMAQPVRADANDQMAGGGEFTGSATYSAGIPPEPGCANTAFTETLASEDSIIDLGSGIPYAGPLTVSIAGTSVGCSSLVLDVGDITASIAGTSITGSISCPSLTGTYDRSAASAVMTLDGSCTITWNSAQGTGSPVFVFQVAMQPTTGDGVFSTITQAHLTGTYAV